MLSNPIIVSVTKINSQIRTQQQWTELLYLESVVRFGNHKLDLQLHVLQNASQYGDLLYDGQ